MRRLIRSLAGRYTVLMSSHEIDVVERRWYEGPKDKYLPYKPDKDLVPFMIKAGDGYRFHTTGLTHDERGYPVINAECQDWCVRHLIDKIDKNADKTLVKIADGGSYIFQYTVDVAQTGYQDSGWEVHGVITVSNPNDWEDITLTGLSDVVDNGGDCTVTQPKPHKARPGKKSRRQTPKATVRK